MVKNYGLVFPETKHFCPICGADYDDYKTAQLCIDSHAKPESIDAYHNFNKALNCPDFVYVTLSDGRLAKYQVCCVFDDDDNNEVAL